MGATASVPTDPTKTLEVIGAGLSRTGTMSVQLALETLLEGPVCHGGTQLMCREDSYCKLWAHAFRSRASGDKQKTKKLPRAATAGFVGITDMPATCFVSELVDLYPSAKVVLVRRDPQKWWASIEEANKSNPTTLVRLLLSPIPGWRWIMEISDAHIKDRMGNWEAEDLTRHYEFVRRTVPKENLLEMELSEGWEPLCKFLGKPIPKQPFPRVNDSAGLAEYARKVLIRVVQVWSGILCGVGGLGYGAYWLYTRA